MGTLTTEVLINFKNDLLKSNLDQIFKGQIIFIEQDDVFKKEKGKYSEDKKNKLSLEISKDMAHYTVKDGVKIFTYLYTVNQNCLVLDGELLVEGEFQKVTPDLLNTLFENKKKDIFHPIFSLCKNIYGTSFIKAFDTKFPQYTENIYVEAQA